MNIVAIGALRVKNLYEASLEIILCREQITKVLIRLSGCAGWFVPLSFACIKVRFSCHMGHMKQPLRFWYLSHI